MKKISRLTALLLALLLIFQMTAVATEVSSGDSFAAPTSIPQENLDVDTLAQWSKEAVEAAEAIDTIRGMGVTANEESIPLRELPALYAETMAVLPVGTFVFVYDTMGTGIISGDWYKVCYNGQDGYIHSSLLNVCNCNVQDGAGLDAHADGCPDKMYYVSICAQTAEEIYADWASYSEAGQDFVLLYLSWTDQTKLAELNALLNPEEYVEREISHSSGITVKGIFADDVVLSVETVVNGLNALNMDNGFVADIDLSGNWGDSVTLTIPLSDIADGETVQMIHFIESADDISTDTPSMDVSGMGMMRSALNEAISAYRKATGSSETRAAVELKNLTVEDGSVSFAADSFSIYAVGEIDTATYKFYNGDVLHDTQVLISGNVLHAPEVPVTEHGVFTRWEDAHSISPEFEVPITVSEGQHVYTYYAKFDPAYQVIFMYEKGSNVVLKTIAAKSGDTVETGAVQYPATENKNVVSWHTSPECTDESIVTEVTVEDEDIVLYPTVKPGYWITFNSAGGTPVDPAFYVEGTVPVAPIAPMKAGYEFKGWAIIGAAEDGSETVTDFDWTKQLTFSVELTAQWTAVEVEYTVVVVLQDANSASVYKPVSTLTWKQKAVTGTEINFDSFFVPGKDENGDAIDPVLAKDEDTQQIQPAGKLASLIDDLAVANPYDDFVINEVNGNWCAIYEDSNEDSVTISGDGGSVVYLKYDRKLIQFLLYEKSGYAENRPNHANYAEYVEISNSLQPTRYWDFDTSGKVLHTVNGRFGQSISDLEEEYRNSTGTEVKFSEYAFNGNYNNHYSVWPLTLTEVAVIPTYAVSTDESAEYQKDEPYYTYRIFQLGESAENVDTWQLYYYVQTLNNAGDDVYSDPENTDLYDVTKWEKIEFDSDDSVDDIKGSVPAISGDAAWELRETREWQDRADAYSNTVIFTPLEGFHLAAYAMEILPHGVYSKEQYKNALNNAEDDAAKALIEKCWVGVGSADNEGYYANYVRYDRQQSTLKTEATEEATDIYAWEVGSDKDTTNPKYWVKLFEETGVINEGIHAYQILDSGEWKYWVGADDDNREDKYVPDANYVDGYGVSYWRNRGDIYLRLLRNQYTITFMDGSNKIGEVTLYYEEDLKQADVTNARDVIQNYAAAHTGMKFDGWYEAYDPEEGDQVFVFEGKMPAHNIVLYANWVPQEVNVYVHLNQEDMQEAVEITDLDPQQIMTMYYGETLAESGLDELQEKVGMSDEDIWYGWCRREQVNDTYVPTPFNFDQQITGELHLYPYFGSDEAYSVIYDENLADGKMLQSGAAPKDELKYLAGSAAVILSGDEMVHPDGKVFLGWNTAEDGTGTTYLAEQLLLMEGDVTLYAIWGDSAQVVTLTYHENLFDSEKSEEVDLQQNFTHEVRENLFTDNEYEKFTFAGWNTKADGTGVWYQPGDDIVVTAENPEATNHLYAQWRSYLTIKKQGLDMDVDPNSSTMFTVVGNGVEMTVAIHGNGSVTVKNLPVGDYTVCELTDWSWRYTSSSDPTSGTVSLNGVDHEITFTNERTKDKWLDGEAYDDNNFAEVSTGETNE